MLQAIARLFVLSLLLAAGVLLASCGSTPKKAGPDDVADSAAMSPPMTAKSVYRLGHGDQIRIIVFDEPTLSGDFRVDDAGYISVPLIGEIKAADLTLRELEDRITRKLLDGYIRDPRVSCEVSNFRPFYIYGEVASAGEYQFVAGMHVLKAIAMAGGYTYRANKKVVMVTRAGSDETLELPATDQTLVLPGDVIRIKERFF